MGNIGLGVKSEAWFRGFPLILMPFGSEHRVAEVWSHFRSAQNMELPSS